MQNVTEQRWQDLVRRLRKYAPEDYSIIEHTPGGGGTQFSERLNRALAFAGWQFTSDTRWNHVLLKASDRSSGTEELAGWMREWVLTVEKRPAGQVESELGKG